MKSVSQFLILFFSIVVSSCGSAKKITAEKPSATINNNLPDSLPVSEINLPVRINLRPIYNLAESQVDTLFTSPKYPTEWVQEGCDVRYKYSFRRSPLQMKASGTSLELGFMGYYRIIGSTRVCVAGAAISPWTAPCSCGFNEAERRIQVSFNNSLSLLPDYKVKLNITRKEPKALDKCEICFWGQDITDQVVKGLKEELDTATVALMKSYGTVDLKPRFQLLWDNLTRVYNIYNMGWLQINPKKVRVNNLYAKGDSLYIYLGLSAQPSISFEKPTVSSHPLPAMTDFSRRSGFNIFLDATLSYDSLSNIMTRQLADKSMDFQKGPVKKKFVVKNCQLSPGTNQRVIVKIDFGGTDNGTVYLTAKPTYNKDSRMLDLKDIEFDIRSKDALLRTAEWLFSKRISNEIAAASRFDLGTYIDNAKLSINQQLNREWMKGINSEGNINDIRLIGIYPLDKALVIRSNCTGDLSVIVSSTDFNR